MLFAKLAHDVHKAMLGVDGAVVRTGLDPALMELVKIRASQVNGCAFCISLHTRDARIAGETEHRIYALNAWRDTSFYTEREQAALALTEVMTFLPDGGVPDDIFEQAARQFTQAELAALIATIAMINAWTRVAIATHMVPLGAQPPPKVLVSHDGGR